MKRMIAILALVVTMCAPIAISTQPAGAAAPATILGQGGLVCSATGATIDLPVVDGPSFLAVQTYDVVNTSPGSTTWGSWSLAGEDYAYQDSEHNGWHSYGSPNNPAPSGTAQTQIPLPSVGSGQTVAAYALIYDWTGTGWEADPANFVSVSATVTDETCIVGNDQLVPVQPLTVYHSPSHVSIAVPAGWQTTDQSDTLGGLPGAGEDIQSTDPSSGESVSFHIDDFTQAQLYYNINTTCAAFALPFACLQETITSWLNSSAMTPDQALTGLDSEYVKNVQPLGVSATEAYFDATDTSTGQPVSGFLDVVPIQTNINGIESVGILRLCNGKVNSNLCNQILSSFQLEPTVLAWANTYGSNVDQFDQTIIQTLQSEFQQLSQFSQFLVQLGMLYSSFLTGINAFESQTYMAMQQTTNETAAEWTDILGGNQPEYDTNGGEWLVPIPENSNESACVTVSGQVLVGQNLVGNSECQMALSNNPPSG